MFSRSQAMHPVIDYYMSSMVVYGLKYFYHNSLFP